MGISVADNFSYLGGKPLDGRIQYATLADMKAMADATLYEGCEAYCVATDKYYKWKSSNTVDADTGKWREVESGGALPVATASTLGGVKIGSGILVQSDGTISVSGGGGGGSTAGGEQPVPDPSSEGSESGAESRRTDPGLPGGASGAGDRIHRLSPAGDPGRGKESLPMTEKGSSFSAGQ